MRTHKSAFGPAIRAWLVDPGCPLDLIDKSYVAHLRHFVQPGQDVTLEAANGDTDTSEVIPWYLQKLAEHITPHIVDKTPNVLSMGRRCVLDGYTFRWDGYSKHPWFKPPGEASEKIT